MDRHSPSNRWELFKLRLMLLRIWFVKNLVTFIKIAVIILVVLMLTGQITAETPIFGTILYPLFQPLIDSIRDVISQRNADSFMSFASIALSILITVTMFTIKMQSICQNDIKNKELKMAMVKAGLYFNENGRMMKKIEQATGTDIDGDGKSDEKEATSNTSLFNSIKNAIGEFITVMKTELPEDSTAKEEISNAAKNIGGEDTLEALEEIDKIVITNALDRASAIIDKKFDETIESVKETENITKEDIKEVKAKTSFINKIRSGLQSTISGVKSVVVREKKANEEKSENKLDENEVLNEVQEEEKVTFNVVDITKEKKPETPVVAPKKETTIVATSSTPKKHTTMDLVRARYR